MQKRGGTGIAHDAHLYGACFGLVYALILNPNGIWVVEFSYLPLLLKNLTYDQICHEHVTYYTLDVFKKIIKHPLTDKGLDASMEDWAKTGQKIL